jgi:2-dehydro-3-deoxyphosphogalactonate aldolase
MDSSQQIEALNGTLSVCGLVAILRGGKTRRSRALWRGVSQRWHSFDRSADEFAKATKQHTKTGDAFWQAKSGWRWNGDGTVMSKRQIDEVNEVGGELIVMPHTDETLIRYAISKDLIPIAGVATPSEAFKAIYESRGRGFWLRKSVISTGYFT